ncbi:MAG TPA: VWA domain-containing protein [Terriglobales bacterium]|nr:VWA domain-containing protein [Terriglobales bacterium]
MRFTRLFAIAPLAAVLCANASAQDATSLPSAPSATLEQQAAPPPAPTAQQQPARQPELKHREKPGQPVLESLDPKPRPVPQPQNTAAQPASTAQNSNETAADQAPPLTIRTAVNEVNVVFAVTDKHNHYVKDLKASDFRVLDNRMPPANIRSFVSETNLPLRVGLLVDSSNSIRDRFRFEQQAAIEFLNQIIHPSRDEAFVLGFDTTPEITQDFTGNADRLANGVRMLRPGGGTAMYDAIYGACRDKLEKKNAEGGVRRAIILLSDGEDNQSRVTRDDAIEEAERADVVVYTISTNVSGTKTRGDKILEAIADATGGRAFFPFKIEEVADAFSQIQEELRSQYAISYKPADFVADGKYRTIDIESVNKKYKVRGRKGYFAPRAETASVTGGK